MSTWPSLQTALSTPSRTIGAAAKNRVVAAFAFRMNKDPADVTADDIGDWLGDVLALEVRRSEMAEAQAAIPVPADLNDAA